MSVVERAARSYTWLRLAAVAGVIFGALSGSIGGSAIQRSLSALPSSEVAEAEEAAAPDVATEPQPGASGGDEASAPPTTDEERARLIEERAAALRAAREARIAAEEEAARQAQERASAATDREPARRAEAAAREAAQREVIGSAAPRSSPPGGPPPAPRPPPPSPSAPSAPPPPPSAPPPPAAAAASPRSFVVYFASGEAVLTPEGAAVLDVAARYIFEANARLVTIIGHNDTLLDAEGSMAISRARAQAVADQLMARGVAAARISVVAFGESELARATPDGVSEPLNRRVEIEINP